MESDSEAEEVLMPIEVRDGRNSGVLQRLVWGALPIVIVCLLLWFAMQSPPRPMIVVPNLVACGIVLWFGWASIKRSTGMKWLGVILALYIGLVLALLVLGIAVRVGLVLLPLFLLALPFLAYDLLFRAPLQGRFSRARAERRYLRAKP